MSFSLANRVALITGSTRGLGLGIAECLAAAGAKIALNYYGNREVAEQARESLLGSGTHALTDNMLKKYADDHIVLVVDCHI